MHILVFDQNRLFRNTLEEFLSDLGHDVECHRSLASFPDPGHTGTETPDLIVAEVAKDRSAALASIRQVHQQWPGIPVVVTLGQDSDLVLKETISNGVHSFLRKPVRLSELEFVLIQLHKMGARSGVRSRTRFHRERTGNRAS